MSNRNHLILLPFGKRIILEDNPAGHYFSIKRFNSNELFQIIHDCETKSVRFRQNVW